MALLTSLFTVPLAAAVRPAYQTVKLFYPWQSSWSIISLLYNREEWNAGGSWPCIGVFVAVKCIPGKLCSDTHSLAWPETTKAFTTALPLKEGKWLLS